MHVKKGDTVKILSGKDRGKTGKILSLDTSRNRAVVEGLNLYFRHQKPRKSGEKGQRLKLPMPIHASNLMLYDPTGKIASRTRKAIDEKGRKIRIGKKSNKEIK